MRPFQWSSMQRMVAFARDMIPQIPNQARVDRSTTSLPGQEGTMAELRSGGQIDSGCESVPFQITNGNLGEQLPCQIGRMRRAKIGIENACHPEARAVCGPKDLCNLPTRYVGPSAQGTRLRKSTDIYLCSDFSLAIF